MGVHTPIALEGRLPMDSHARRFYKEEVDRSEDEHRRGHAAAGMSWADNPWRESLQDSRLSVLYDAPEDFYHE
jgi:hypothetical protein